MSYFKKFQISVAECPGELILTDDAALAGELRAAGEAVLVYLHSGNRDQNFSDFTYAVEEPESLEQEYLEKVYRRLKGLPWQIAVTRRCLIRETIVEDVEDFYRIYAEPSITKHMENLYPDPEQERQYVRDYIEKVYAYYEFGLWTVVEKKSGAVIGRAGLFCREGYDEPELGFVVGVPWQRQGFAEEICRAILEYGREVLRFESVQVFVETENVPSLALCHKLGFQETERIQIKGKEYWRMLTDLL